MISITYDESTASVLLEPHGSITIHDILSARRVIDGHLMQEDEVLSLIIYSESFPGWYSFEAFLEHMKFVKDHHQHIRAVAIVSDSVFTNIAKTLAQHFIKADIKQFAFSELNKAKSWISEKEP